MYIKVDHIILFFLVLVFLIAIYFYKKFRQRLPKKQICWFCHKPQEVPFSKTNAFDCVHCHQYNGFSEDGNYNKMISAQYEPKNSIHYCQPIADCYSKSVQLCSECNVRQEIKIKLLAQFIPFNEMNFSQECDEYKKHLDSEYKLCSECQIKVKEVLSMPINCVKVESTANASKVKPNIDSVFINGETGVAVNCFSFVTVTAFQTISLFSAVILLIAGLRSLQNNTDLSLIDFSENLIQFVDYYLSNQAIVIYSGFVCSLSALVINGKQSVQTTDLFVQLLWLALIATETPIISGYIDRLDGLLLRPILSSFVIIFWTINTSLRSFALFKANFKRKTNERKALTEWLFAKRTKNNELDVCANGRQEKSFSDNDIKSNKTRKQSIGEQINSLSIADESVPTLGSRQTKHFRTENKLFAKSTVNAVNPPIFDNSFSKSIILPARFNPEPIAQTSWVSTLKPNTSPLKNRKENLNSLPYYPSSHAIVRTSQWLGHQWSGLVTPPPSATTSVCSDTAFGFNRLAPLNGNKCLSPNMFDSQRNDMSNKSVMKERTHLISHHMYSRESSVTNSQESDVTQVSHSLSTLTIKRGSENSIQPIHYKPSFAHKLTQNFVLALFLLLLFCFVIFLSLPVVFRASCDLNSLHFHFTIESLPQNDVCIK